MVDLTKPVATLWICERCACVVADTTRHTPRCVEGDDPPEYTELAFSPS